MVNGAIRCRSHDVRIRSVSYTDCTLYGTRYSCSSPVGKRRQINANDVESKGGWSGEDETPIEASKKRPNSCCIRRCCNVERKGWASSSVVDGGVEGRQQGG